MSGKERTTWIVGAGVIGLSLAHELLRAGRRVRLLDRRPPGGGATQAAGGMLAPVSEAEIEPPEMLELGFDSLARFPAFVDEVTRISGLACGYRREGTLWAAASGDDRAEVEHVAGILADRGMEFESCSGREMRDLEPHLSSRVSAGLRIPGDHQVDPRALTRALARAVEVQGGSILQGVSVEAVHASSGGVSGMRVRQGDGRVVELETDEVVLAGGAWTHEGIDLPLELPAVRPVKGQLLRLFGEPLIRHVVRTPDVYLIPREDGELLVGASMEELGFDERPTAGPVMDLLRHAWEVLPGVYELELREVSVGLRSATDDQLPRIGPTEIPGLYTALAHYRNGVLLAPATAAHLASCIVEGELPTPLEPFAVFGSRDGAPQEA